jgi:nicotinate-nucleotide pyrophosphorylase (carboxylating)
MSMGEMTLADLIRAALREDMPNGDLTTDSLGLAPRFGQARLVAKQDLVLSGTAPFEQTMAALDPSIQVQWHFREGDRILNRQIICHVSGNLMQILKAERVALNFVGHLSGIATLTRSFVDRVSQTSTKILDTRKTLPAYRDLEKRAVAHGGGQNHRYNLSDAVLIKDNHIMVSGGLRKAVERIRANTSEPIEVECATLDDVREAIALGVERALLDNMDDATLAEAVRLAKAAPKPFATEASGNMNLERVGRVAEIGVNFISVGALTHSAPVADVSLLFDWQQSEMTGI